FASRSSWRPLVTPKPAPKASQPKPCTAAQPQPSTSAPAAPKAAPSMAPAFAPRPAPAEQVSPLLMTSSVLAPHAPPAVERVPVVLDAGTGDREVIVEPTMISIAQWGRLNDGELFAKSRHIEWAVLMKRTWGLDVMKCPACGHRLRVLATIPNATV